MYEIETSMAFKKWYDSLRDDKVVSRINARIEMLKNEHLGDYKNLSNNLFELRINVSGGIRVYYTKVKDKIIILLVGGNKSSQKKDIEKAEKMIKELK
ncbi:MAG: type II toxin-antitoxin system RelE/ParE family toxin [Bifidobacteriaceae bacterium]|jgi:putative addiction module killer protein|nr:type II toxin-antitoxin system RelE/ParE family toxin [Bifidobacteriaceae bacterium]